MVRARWALAAVVLVALHASAARAQSDDDIGRFYGDLAPYGEWISTPQYGFVWSPYGMDVDWRPYTRGHWIYTDFGWTWVSDEPWGWAVFHYGRWLDSDLYGWVWVPGEAWGPAWVAWREGDDCVGWAPLPPGVRWVAGAGLSWGDVDFARDLPWHAWVFCEPRWLAEKHLRRHLWGIGRNLPLLDRTRNVTHYGTSDRHVVDRGFDADRWERLTGHRLHRYRIGDLPEGEPDHGHRIDGDVLRTYRPHIGRATTARRPPEPAPDRSFDRQRREQSLEDLQRRRLEEMRTRHDREQRRLKAGEDRDALVRRQRDEEARLRARQQQEHEVLERKAERRRERSRDERPAPQENRGRPAGGPGPIGIDCQRTAAGASPEWTEGSP